MIKNIAKPSGEESKGKFDWVKNSALAVIFSAVALWVTAFPFFIRGFFKGANRELLVLFVIITQSILVPAVLVVSLIGLALGVVGLILELRKAEKDRIRLLTAVMAICGNLFAFMGAFEVAAPVFVLSFWKYF